MGDDDASSKSVVLKIFGPELGERLALAAGYGKRKDYRGVLEPTDPTTQCKKSGHPFVPNMKCYICDQPIPPKETLSGSDDELYPECEHVFSMTEARWFLDIYMTQNPPKDEWTKRAIELEYEYAHRVCNQAKSNNNFFSTGPDGNPMINMVSIRKILFNIQARARKAVANYTNRAELQAIMETIGNTIITRAEAVRARAQKCIDHVVSGTGGDPNFKTMFLLARTAILTDPTSLPPAVRAIHDEWYANAPQAQTKKIELINGLIQNTYLAYPQFQSGSLYQILFNGVLPNLQVKPDLIEKALREYYANIPIESSNEKKLLSSVYYRLCIDVLSELLSSRPPPIDAICVLYGRLNVIKENEPDVVTLFGLPPALGPLATQCEIKSKAQEREYRTRARELNLLPEDEELPTPEEDATYVLNDLEPELKKIGFQNTAGIMTAARDAFIEAYPEGIDRAKEAAANEVDGIIRLAFLKQDPNVADRIATQIYTFILSARSEDVTMTGGFKTRRPLYSNARILEGTSTMERSERLRKRTRKGSTFRVRKHSRKSTTRRQH